MHQEEKGQVMKTIRNRFVCAFAALFTLVAALALCPAEAMAYPAIDLTKTSTVTISYQYDGVVPVSGMEFKLWNVASVNATNWKFTLLEDYQGSGVVYPASSEFTISTSSDNKDKANQLLGYVQEHELAATDSGVTNADGETTISGLEPGLYLLYADPAEVEVNGKVHTYTVVPTLLMLPYPDEANNTWDYAPTINPKPGDPYGPESETASVSVVKVWDDNDNADSQRPSSVNVTLLKDGETYESVELTAASSWRYQWDELDGSAVWSVVEDNVPEGYAAGVTVSDNVFQVVNKRAVSGGTEPTVTTASAGTTRRLPQTGQDWLPIPILLVAGFVLLVVGMVKRHSKERDE